MSDKNSTLSESSPGQAAVGHSTQGESLKIHGVLFLVQVAFATLAVEGKIAMGPGHRVAPQALAMARILGTAMVFVAVHLVTRTRRVKSIADMGRMAVLAFFGVVLNQVLFLTGLRQTSPVAATLLVATIPVFTALIGAITGRDRLTARTSIGIAIAVLGIAVLSGFALPGRGDVLVLLNAASYAIYVVYAKGMLARYGTVTAVAWVFGSGAILLAPFGLTTLVHDAPSWSFRTAMLVAFIVSVPTVLAYSLNAWALRRANPTLVTVYVYLQPLVVVTLAYLQLGQAIDLRTVMAGLLIFAGVGVVATAPRGTRHDGVGDERTAD